MKAHSKQRRAVARWVCAMVDLRLLGVVGWQTWVLLSPSSVSISLDLETILRTLDSSLFIAAVTTHHHKPLSPPLYHLIIISILSRSTETNWAFSCLKRQRKHIHAKKMTSFHGGSWMYVGTTLLENSAKMQTKFSLLTGLM
ncbi:hypothetical protein L2E82_15677 [Cichorium intybus]|uniref:Uncharacterized protein n=1 Tax=Cichorium intybus TaxID=13427 RepID=A0ACB9F3F4_CICIN|nr:hypothetical protein L2E82_15677 [Cichorium intybus]